MGKKIFKFEYLILFFLSLISLYVYFYENTLADNAFVIKSSQNDIALISYYFSSAIKYIDFYVGPWVGSVFILGLVFFPYVRKRNFLLRDTLLFIPIFFLCLGIHYFFFRDFLGQGLLTLFNIYVGREALILFSISSCLILAKIILPSVGIGKRFSIFNRLVSYFSFYNRLKTGLVRTKNVKQILDIEVLANISPKKKKAVQKVLKKEKEPSSVEIHPSEKKQDYFQIVSKVDITKNRKSSSGPSNKYFEEIIQKIEAKLLEFKIDGQIINVLKGPVVDTFELELGPGVKVSRVTSSSEDLSLALYGAPVRIVYPMLGKSTVGVEVPRDPREVIYLNELIQSKVFSDNKYYLPIGLGKDAFGESFITDLASMPHMLVAGSTGAGKSVFINAILFSLLVKRSPKEMKLVLIDPKQLELALYANLPHLSLPVITDAKGASRALRWAVCEMERRYSLLKEAGVRNIQSYNEKVRRPSPELKEKLLKFYSKSEIKGGLELPFLVIIIDEFADLILTKAGKEIENTICRLAAKARASGIHLILATQRPSVDVITGLIKSNFPTRVSFRVTTSVDSRTILNAIGAEKLLGKGDMLYKHGVETRRAHSAYVDEKEIELLTQALAKMPPSYNREAIRFLDNEDPESADPYEFGTHLPSAFSLFRYMTGYF